MAKTYFLVLFCSILINCQVYGYQSIHRYTTPQVITTPNYPEPYPAYFNCTWKWSKDTGMWAVLFKDLDVSCRDWVYVEDIQSKKKYPTGCSHSTVMPIYIHGPLLEIRFSTTDNHNALSGFKIRILSGINLDDLKGQVYDLKQIETETKDQTTSHVYIHVLLYVLLAVIITIIIGVLAVWLIISKRRGRDLTVAVSVNHIRRGTGVSFVRSASTSESITSKDTETTKVEIERKRVIRTPSQRSWTTRAALATKTNEAVDNLYSPMGNYENQINRPLSALIEYDPLSKPVPNSNVHPTTICGYEAAVVPKK